MPLSVHLFLHFSVAVLLGYVAGRYFGYPGLCLVAAILGGFLIDFDHILEYFLVFGPHFNVTYFLQGRQFLISGKTYLWFHAWEWLPILALLAWSLKREPALQVFVITLTLAMAVHIFSDCLINHYPPKFYSFSYRASQNFSAAKLLSPAEYQKDLRDKADLGL